MEATQMQGAMAEAVEDVEVSAAEPSPELIRAKRNLMDKLTPRVTDALHRAVEHHLEQHDQLDAEALEQFDPISKRLENKIYEDFKASFKAHSFRRPLVGNKDACVPYLDDLEKVAPGLRERIEAGEVDLIDLANSDEVGTKRVPKYMVDSFLPPNLLDSSHASSANMHIPYNNMLPYSAKALTAAQWQRGVKAITGDRARGIPASDFWHATSPPYGITHAGESGSGDLNFARFSLPTAIMVLRKHATLPRAHSLNETFYCEHPQNTLGATASRFTFCGPGFVGAKHAAEIFNGIVQTAHGNPQDGTADHARVLPHIFTKEDVGASLAAVSLALQHGGERAAKQAELFFVNCDEKLSSPAADTHILRRPVCHLQTEEDKETALALLDAYKEAPFEGTKQDLEEQRARQSASDVLNVRTGHNFQWGHAKDQIIKHHFVRPNSAATKARNQGARPRSPYKARNQGKDNRQPVPFRNTSSAQKRKAK